MYARTSTWSGSAQELDSWAGLMESKVAPMVRGLPGNAGAMFLVDRDAGQAFTLTLWATDQAALTSDQTADASRASTVAATGVELVGRGRYEVVAKA